MTTDGFYDWSRNQHERSIHRSDFSIIQNVSLITHRGDHKSMNFSPVSLILHPSEIRNLSELHDVKIRAWDGKRYTIFRHGARGQSGQLWKPYEIVDDL